MRWNTIERCFVVTLILLTTCLSTVFAYESVPRKMWDKVSSLDATAYQMEEDPPYGGEYYYGCGIQYYYFVPCPTYSWFWAYSGWERGDIVGSYFTMGEQKTGGLGACRYCETWIVGISILDLTGGGSFAIDIYGLNQRLYPNVHLWRSHRVWTEPGWNYIGVDPPLEIRSPDQGSRDYPSVFVTLTMLDASPACPGLGFDNVSTPARAGCEMHDLGCLTAVYPRKPVGSAGTAVHSGYVGKHLFEHWPPLGIPDGAHASNPSGDVWYGYVEPAWRVYMDGICPSAEK